MKWPEWIRNYRRVDFPQDLLSSLVLLVLLVPQSVAYATLAGLPAQAGLLASVFPALAYAWFGRSAALSVGPAALPALMTASALFGLAVAGSPQYVVLAAILAIGSGLIRLLMAAVGFGFLANFLSRPVIGGFISGSAILIATSQIAPMFGISVSASNFPEFVMALSRVAVDFHPEVVGLSLLTLVLLWLGPRFLKPMLGTVGFGAMGQSLGVRAWPVMVIVLTTVLTAAQGWQVTTVGEISLTEFWLDWPVLTEVPWLALLPGMLAIALVGFVDSMSIAESLAMKRRETVHPQQELLALGSANVVAGITGGFPVSGSFGRSAANHFSGVRTPLGGVLAAVWMGLVLMFAGSLFTNVPLAVLSATIVMAVGSLIDFEPFKLAWHYDRRDAFVFMATLLGVLLFGVMNAILVGMALSLLLMVWRTSQPHMAVVGRVPGTEHFRNIHRHQVETVPGVLLVRVDESFYFANIRQICRHLSQLISSTRTEQPVQHLVLLMSAVNVIDVSALQTLLEFNRDLLQEQVTLHLAEVKGPVMDALEKSGACAQLSGQVFLSAHLALETIQSAELSPPRI